MKTKKQYIAEDNAIFDDKFECARYELQNQELRDRIAALMAGKPLRVQRNWCGGDPDEGYGGACACMGCVNNSFWTLGLEYAHWKVWFNEIRVNGPTDEISDDDNVDIFLTDIGPEKKAVYSFLRVMTGLGAVEVNSIMKNPDAFLKFAIPYYEGQYYVQELGKLGAKLSMKKSSKQP